MKPPILNFLATVLPKYSPQVEQKINERIKNYDISLWRTFGLRI